jgi:hypothetical protein
MSNLKTRSEAHLPAPLTPEQRYDGEKNLAHLIIVAHDEGVEAALQEWDKIVAAKRAKAPD